MIYRKWGRQVAGLLLAAVTSIGATAAPLYSIQDLGPLWAQGHPGAVAAINSHGEVVGVRSGVPFAHANGISVDLDSSGAANGINDLHQVVGVSATNRGFVYSNGVRTDLGDLGYGGDVVAYGINDAGQVVGSAFNGTVMNAFLYANGVMQELAPAGALFAAAYDINSVGVAVGVADNIAVMFTGGVATRLGTLGGSSSVAWRINEASYAVGYAYLAGNARRHAAAFFNGAAVDLTPGFDGDTFAYGINDVGQIVGTASPVNGTQFAFVLTEGVLLDLNTQIDPGLGWQLTNSGGINDRGEIAGAGFLGGEYHAFLLTPTQVPEPGIDLLCAIGLLALLALRSYSERLKLTPG